MTSPQRITVSETHTGWRLDVFLSEFLAITRSQAQKMIGEGAIVLNGQVPFKTGIRIAMNDVIEIVASVRAEKKARNIAEDKSPALVPEIVDEQPEFVVVNKPTGMLTHITGKNEPNALAELMVQKYPEMEKVGESPDRPGVVHRLDKEASGLIVLARTHDMFDCLKQQFKLRTVDKEYMVLVHGQVAKDTDEINFPISRSENAERMAAMPQTVRGETQAEGRTALTEFIVEKRYVNFTLLKVKIHTGRTHQIRVHMFAYNHPVVGDPMYFQKKRSREADNRLGRLFLHCSRLAFVDTKGERHEYESPVPETLSKFLTTLK